MTIQTRFMEWICGVIGEWDAIAIGPPAEGSMEMQTAAPGDKGSVDDQYLDRSSRRHLTLRLVCKDTAGQALDRLFDTCNRLERMREFPQQEGYQILGFQVESDPQFVERDEPGGLDTYSAVLRAYYYYF